MTAGYSNPAASELPAELFWHTLIELNCALLDEVLPHQRRTLILNAIATFTGKPGGLWLLHDGPQWLDTAPDWLKLVAETEQPVVTPLADNSNESEQFQAIPLFDRQGRQLIGIVCGAFTRLPAVVTRSLVAQIQLAFEISGFDARFEQLRAIAEVSRAIVSELDLDKLLQLVADLLHERFGYPFIHIFVVHRGRRWIEFKAGVGDYASQRRRELSVSMDDQDGLIPWVVRSAQSALINNVYQDSHFRPLSLPGIDIKSELTVPLVFAGEVLGVFDVESESFNAFTPDDLWLLETLAATIAIALRNAILYRSERWRAQSADSLRRIAGLLRSSETLHNTLSAILEQLATILPVTLAAIWLKTEQGYQLTTGYPAAESYSLQPINHPWFDAIVQTRSSLLRSSADLPIPLAEDFPPDHSALGATLMSDENVLGVLILAHRQANRFGREAQNLVEIFAGQAAVVIENTDLFFKAQQQAWISTVLLQVAQTVVIHSDLSEVLQTVVRLTPMLTGVSHCLIFLYSENHICTLAAAYGLKGIELPLEIDLTTFIPLQNSIQHNLPQLLTSPVQISAGLRRGLAQPDFQGLILPLSVKNSVVGTLMVVDNHPQSRLTDKRNDILTGIAYQVALAIDNARLYTERARQDQFERELQLARDIQLSFIPQDFPDPPGWELATMWKMAHEVGGDFFDVIAMPPDRLFIIIADVADKGLPASLFMVRTSSLVRAAALELDQPAQIMAQVNRLLAQNAQKGMFVTAFCAVLNLSTGELTYASAGHNPPVLVKQARQMEMLHAHGIVLGVIDPFIFEQKTIQIQPGDGLLLYTDGVTEAFNDHDEIFGTDRLLKTISRYWNLPATGLVDEIYNTVSEFAHPHPQSDDFTLLLLRKK